MDLSNKHSDNLNNYKNDNIIDEILSINNKEFITGNSEFDFDNLIFHINSDEKLNKISEKDSKKLEFFKLKKEEMRKKTREKRKENNIIKREEKYSIIKQMTEGYKI